MKSFDKLLEVSDRLLAQDGCPWDREQTFKSLRPYLLEEAHEALEAIDEDQDEMIIEELGDLLYIIIFYAKLGAIQERFTIEEVLETVREKMVRRHPHIFGDVKVKKVEEVIYHWERIKKLEKSSRKSPLEGIPKSLGIVSRAQKVLRKMISEDFELPFMKKQLTEEELGEQLLSLVYQAEASGIDSEQVMRKALKNYENNFVDNYNI